jgi:hypothetical protein
MTEPDVAPLDPSQHEALVVFERFYDAIDEALAESDADQVERLVAERQGALSRLLEALGGRRLPEAESARVAAREADTTAELERFSREILAQLLESRQHAHARARYAQTEQAGLPPGEAYEEPR